MTETDGSAEVADLEAADVDVVARDLARRDTHHLAVALPSYAVGFALLRFDPARWTAVGWAGIAAGVLVGVTLIVAVLRLGSGTEGRRRRYLVEHAVLHHLDPGPGRRAAADHRARDMARGGWLLVMWPALLAVQAASGDFDQPVAAGFGIALFGITLASLVPYTVRRWRAGRRWLADPPGPPRD
ncbi:hypothetical protein DQ244_15105 [Blastococcus sp. TBT05-19]|uniref:hypothetical protein n=1 Tax=Blastococcus sp. TBT05-19 TaxID=2250581 RepID=UPI000DEBBF22|nr:hypothetical protein [Blastococcus sp. TBT05-19]RBY89087.1 hypothetical protein DQ244_15105 [Blastococcus sp. TBT05-19]